MTDTTHNGGGKCLLLTWFPLLFPQLGFRVQKKINAFTDKVMWGEHPTHHTLPTTIHLNLQSHKDDVSATCQIILESFLLVLLSGGYACPASHSTASAQVNTHQLPLDVDKSAMIK